VAATWGAEVRREWARKSVVVRSSLSLAAAEPALLAQRSCQRQLRVLLLLLLVLLELLPDLLLAVLVLVLQATVASLLKLPEIVLILLQLPQPLPDMALGPPCVPLPVSKKKNSSHSTRTRYLLAIGPSATTNPPIGRHRHLLSRSSRRRHCHPKMTNRHHHYYECYRAILGLLLCQPTDLVVVAAAARVLLNHATMCLNLNLAY